jgi:REP element-mobilizing transposase RayT
MSQTNKESGHEGQERRYPVDPNRHHRENGWDYKGRAIYHFTLPVEERYPLFGTLEGDSAETAHVWLNSFGYRVLQMLCNLPAFYAEKGFALKVLAQKVMPDHLHLVIQVLEPLPKSIGTVVRGFKAACTKLYKQEYFPGGDNAAQLHGDTPMSDALVHFARIFAGRGSIWQQDPAYYHERILHAPGQLRRMIDYVKDNPRRLWLKTHNPDLFKIHRQTEVRGMTFTSLGNHFLLGWPDRQLVEMSRSATEEQVQEHLRSVLAMANNGTVTYTAAISKGEQYIARTVREQGYPLVVLLNDGFPEEGSPKERFFKPGGTYFEACAKGQLLLLEPTEQTYVAPFIQDATEETLRHKAEAKHFDYAKLPIDSRRYRFVALNEIGRLLVSSD